MVRFSKEVISSMAYRCGIQVRHVCLAEEIKLLYVVQDVLKMILKKFLSTSFADTVIFFHYHILHCFNYVHLYIEW